jgi:hypothetical protein
MSQFILTKEQHLAFKAAWKQFLKAEAKELKKQVKNGNYSKGYSISYHLLRQILVADVQHIEAKIQKAFASQRQNIYDHASRSGLSVITSYFSVKNKSHMLNRYKHIDAEFLKSLTDEQLDQINKIATDIYNKYVRGDLK